MSVLAGFIQMNAARTLRRSQIIHNITLSPSQAEILQALRHESRFHGTHAPTVIQSCRVAAGQSSIGRMSKIFNGMQPIALSGEDPDPKSTSGGAIRGGRIVPQLAFYENFD
jgi:hypothetical protein